MAWLLNLAPHKIAQAAPATLTEYGHLLETFAVGEMLKQASWSDAPVTAGHFRTESGDEADLVLERDDGQVIAVEIKAGSRISGEDFRGPRQLKVGRPGHAGQLSSSRPPARPPHERTTSRRRPAMTRLCVSPFGRMRQGRDTAQMCQVKSGSPLTDRDRKVDTGVDTPRVGTARGGRGAGGRALPPHAAPMRVAGCHAARLSRAFMPRKNRRG